MRQTRTKSKPPVDGAMRAEYDFSSAVRGKYAARFARGSNVVVLAPDVAEAFRTTRAVNAALRAQLAAKPTPPPRSTRRRSAGR